MRRDKFAALRAQIDTLRRAVGFVGLRRPDGPIGRYTAGHFCGVLDYVREGETDAPAVEALSPTLMLPRTSPSLACSCRPFRQWCGSMARTISPLSVAALFPTPASRNAKGVPPGDPFADDVEARVAENERIRTAPLSELTTAERRKRFARNVAVIWAIRWEAQNVTSGGGGRLWWFTGCWGSPPSSAYPSA
jgi:hypothetical protein